MCKQICKRQGESSDALDALPRSLQLCLKDGPNKVRKTVSQEWTGAQNRLGFHRPGQKLQGSTIEQLTGIETFQCPCITDPTSVLLRHQPQDVCFKVEDSEDECLQDPETQTSKDVEVGSEVLHMRCETFDMVALEAAGMTPETQLKHITSIMSREHHMNLQHSSTAMRQCDNSTDWNLGLHRTSVGPHSSVHFEQIRTDPPVEDKEKLAPEQQLREGVSQSTTVGPQLPLAGKDLDPKLEASQDELVQVPETQTTKAAEDVGQPALNVQCFDMVAMEAAAMIPETELEHMNLQQPPTATSQSNDPTDWYADLQETKLETRSLAFSQGHAQKEAILSKSCDSTKEPEESTGHPITNITRGAEESIPQPEIECSPTAMPHSDDPMDWYADLHEANLEPNSLADSGCRTQKEDVRSKSFDLTKALAESTGHPITNITRGAEESIPQPEIECSPTAMPHSDDPMDWYADLHEANLEPDSLADSGCRAQKEDVRSKSFDPAKALAESTGHPIANITRGAEETIPQPEMESSPTCILQPTDPKACCIDLHEPELEPHSLADSGCHVQKEGVQSKSFDSAGALAETPEHRIAKITLGSAETIPQTKMESILGTESVGCALEQTPTEIHNSAKTVAEPGLEAKMLATQGDGLTVAPGASEVLDLHGSGLEELQLACVYCRQQSAISSAHGYISDDDGSGCDEEEGFLTTERLYHDNGNPKYKRTYQRLSAKGLLPQAQRLVEEKHFDVGGMCQEHVRFGLGQPYLSRKRFYQNQRLKSEQLFFCGG